MITNSLLHKESDQSRRMQHVVSELCFEKLGSREMKLVPHSIEDDCPLLLKKRFARRMMSKPKVFSLWHSQMNISLPLTNTPPEDLNVKFLRSLPSEWDTHVVVWMNKPDFETMGLDDLYNNFKIVKQKVKRTVAANNDDKNLAFLTTSSPSSTNTINTVNTAELEKVKEEKEGFEFKLAKFEKSSKDLDDLLANHTSLEEFKQPEVNEYGPRDSSLKLTTVCDRESDNSKENTDDSLTQQPKTVTETSSVMSPLKVDKDWKEKFFHPANHIRVEEPKKAREILSLLQLLKIGVSYEREEVEPIPKVEKKTSIPTSYIESVQLNLKNQLEDQVGQGDLMLLSPQHVRDLLLRYLQSNEGVSESSTSSHKIRDCIVMPIRKDASIFDDASLKSGLRLKVIGYWYKVGLQKQKIKGEFIAGTKQNLCPRTYTRKGIAMMTLLLQFGKAFGKDADADDVMEPSLYISDWIFDVSTRIRPISCLQYVHCAKVFKVPQNFPLLAVKRIFRYLKGKPSLGLWYSKDSPLELVAYTDSDYAGATQDRKSTTKGSLDPKPIAGL
ncbi:hypothetical protein Tco_0485145 [Tanacetum coccineum]